jgi:hypothetical protein
LFAVSGGTPVALSSAWSYFSPLWTKFRIFTRQTVACRLTLAKHGFSGDKQKQSSDINPAQEYLKDYKGRTETS